MSNPNIHYRVGDALDPHPNDVTFFEYDAAEEEALLQDAEKNCVIAIWEIEHDTGHATTHRLVFQNTVWSPQ